MGLSEERTLPDEGSSTQYEKLRETGRGDQAGESWLKPGEVLVHIGPHKTGTTALQSSLAAARVELEEAGVLYPGPLYSHYRASTQLRREPQNHGREWSDLAAAVNGRTDRAIISSEYFDQADAQTARLALAQLGGSRARVLVTLRPLHKILPGLWQQYVKNGSTEPLDSWLDELLSEDRLHPLWQSLDQGKLVARWADAVGPGRLAVLVVDAARPDGLLRDIEELVGLPPGLLRPQDTNRSLTAPEAELIRTLNDEPGFLENDPDIRKRWIRFGAIKHLVENRSPDPSEARLALPEWAETRIRADQSSFVDEISQLGVHVVGDLSSLASSNLAGSSGSPSLDPTSDLSIGPRDGQDVVANEVAIDLIVGLTQKANGARLRLEKRLLRERAARRAAETRARSARLDHVAGRELVSEIARRTRTRAQGLFLRS